MKTHVGIAAVAGLTVGLFAGGGKAAGAVSAPVPVTYIMVCCHGADKGTKFLANGAWDSRHDYRDYYFARDMMKKIKESGINVVGIDCIFWGIADVRNAKNGIHVHESTTNDPHAYYNVVKEEIEEVIK